MTENTDGLPAIAALVAEAWRPIPADRRAATVLTRDLERARLAARRLPVGTVKINSVFGGAPGRAAHPRRGSGAGFGYGPELLDEMAFTKVIHLETPPAAGCPGRTLDTPSP